MPVGFILTFPVTLAVLACRLVVSLVFMACVAVVMLPVGILVGACRSFLRGDTSS